MCVLLQVVHTKFIPMVELKLNVNTLFYVTLVSYLAWKNKELTYKGNAKGKSHEGGETWKIALTLSHPSLTFTLWKMLKKNGVWEEFGC